MDFQHMIPCLKETAHAILEVDSPTGFTARAVERAEQMARAMGYETRRSKKGNLTILVEGRDRAHTVGLCAHVDTLGLMVRAITSAGELMFTKVGGAVLPSLHGEYCKIYTRDGRVYTGTILSLSPAAHVFDDARTRPQDEQNMYVRVDEKVRSAEDVRSLGIEVGDYICYDPKTVFTDSGFLKSRFIDDKGSVSILLTLLRWMKENGKRPRCNVEITFTVYEELGHGGATFSPNLEELLAVDMGCVGADLNCDEYHVSICAADSSGPFDYGMVSRLLSLARENGIPAVLDVYPHYSSDVAVAWKSGLDAPAALIGPGVQASHGMERTHLEAMLGTMSLVERYLDCQ